MMAFEIFRKHGLTYDGENGVSQRWDLSVRALHCYLRSSSAVTGPSLVQTPRHFSGKEIRFWTNLQSVWGTVLDLAEDATTFAAFETLSRRVS